VSTHTCALTHAHKHTHTHTPQVAAHLFEIGCAVHSVIIGIALGVNTDDRAVARNYTIALVFHQLIEAVALGAYIAIADLGAIKSESCCVE